MSGRRDAEGVERTKPKLETGLIWIGGQKDLFDHIVSYELWTITEAALSAFPLMQNFRVL